MRPAEEAEELAQKQTNNLLIDGPGDNDVIGTRIRRNRRLHARIRLLFILIVILVILLVITTGFAVYLGVANHLIRKAQPKNVTDETDSGVSDAFRKRISKNVRLPYNILPRYYDLRLQVHLHSGDRSAFFFNGSVEVDVFCHSATDVVFVHAYLTLNVSLDHIKIYRLDGKIPVYPSMQIKNISYDSDLQWYEIKMVQKFQPGQYYRIVFGKFWSYLRSELKGWYLSSYEEKGVVKYLATSQLQPTDARRVFPCWDEPALKAIFRITLIRHKDYHSLSNMQLEKTVSLPDDWYADIFYPTVNTTTYLLAFVVSQFDALSGVDYKGRNFTVWTRPEVIHTAKYALELGKKIIRFFEEYFEVPYPLEKTDMIAVPDFAAGAMENWGLMIYREATMLWDEKTGTAASQQKVASVISHEIAHQWFGNLVTLTWWDDLWLNEGFASFAENIGVNHVHPEWGMDEQFLLDDIQKVLISDAHTSSRPVIQAVNFPNEINEIFDPISYNKGASVLRMMQSFMGTEAFRLGIKNYLSEYKFKNTVHEDLWKSMTQAARVSGKPIDVKSIMETWLLQMNYPLVTVERIGPQIFRFTQSRYLDPEDVQASNNSSPFNFSWYIPLTFGDIHTIHSEETRLIWLKNETMTTQLDIDPNSWYVFNLRQTGFYRVLYTEDNWRALAAQLHKDHSAIPVHSRSQIIDDLFNLVNRGTVPYDVFLDLTKYLSLEDSYVGWETAVRAFGWIMRMLIMDPAYGSLLAYIRTLVDRPLQQVNWVALRGTENHMSNLLRVTITQLACRANHPTCVAKSRELFRGWMNNTSVNSIPPSLRSVVYCMGVQWGGHKEWQFLHRQLDRAHEEEMSHILHGLSCTRDSWNMKQYLSILQKEFEISELMDTVTLMSQNPLGQLLMWEQIRATWRRMNAEYVSLREPTTDASLVMMMLRVLSRPQHTMYNVPPPDEVVELKRMCHPKTEKHIFQKSIKEFIKRAEQNNRWTLRHRANIYKWLKKNVPDDTVLL